MMIIKKWNIRQGYGNFFLSYDSFRVVLLYKNIDQPRGIAVDPRKGLLFWTDWGQVGFLADTGNSSSKDFFKKY